VLDPNVTAKTGTQPRFEIQQFSMAKTRNQTMFVDGDKKSFPSPGRCPSICASVSVTNCSWSSVTTTKISVYSIDYKKWAVVEAVPQASQAGVPPFDVD